MYHCKLIKSNRRSISISINHDGSVTIRAPKRASNSHIDEFLKEKQGWIKKNVEKMKKKQEKANEFLEKYDPKKINYYKKIARETITDKVEHYAENHGYSYSAIRLSSAKGRWGSCSANNSLNFNWRIIFAPEEVINYLIVHELVHTVHKHHQRAFWNEVAEILPNHKTSRKWLKDHSYLLVNI